MKPFKQISILFAAVAFAAAMVGCASSPTQESTGQYIGDTAITAKVKAAIFNDASLKSKEINVETFKGAVQLSGFVADPSDMSRAVAVAKGVSGVTAVKNDMRVK